MDKRGDDDAKEEQQQLPSTTFPEKERELIGTPDEPTVHHAAFVSNNNGDHQTDNVNHQAIIGHGVCDIPPSIPGHGAVEAQRVAEQMGGPYLASAANTPSAAARSDQDMPFDAEDALSWREEGTLQDHPHVFAYRVSDDALQNTEVENNEFNITAETVIPRVEAMSVGRDRPWYKSHKVLIVATIALVGASLCVALIFTAFVARDNDDSGNLAPLSTTVPSSSPTKYSQFRILKDIFKWTGGPDNYWIESEGWADSEDSNTVCSWWGVTCDESLQVTHIELMGNGLAGDMEAVATSLQSMYSLRELNLQSNMLTGDMTKVSDMLARIATLKTLDLRFNMMTGSVTNEMCELRDTAGSALSEVIVDCGVRCSCCDHDTLCECSDVENWVDGENDGCEWYGALNTRCAIYGNSLENNGLTANTACCICGGGIVYDPVPSVQPSMSMHPSTTPSDAPTELTAREILDIFYHATNGDGWIDNTNWLDPEKDISKWHGINILHMDGIEINLRGNNLTGTLDPSIGYLSDLLRLDLFNNTIASTIPSEIGLLENKLELLNLNTNEFTGAIPTEVGFLSVLNALSLSSNSLSGTIPSEFGMLERMDMLFLSDNELTGAIPSELGNVAKLTMLGLKRNCLSATLPTELERLSRLSTLEIQGNELSGTIPSGLGSYYTGTYRVSFNNFTGTIPSELGLSQFLLSLELNNNALTGNIPSELGKLNKLQGDYGADKGSLRLDNNSLVGTIPTELGQMISIKRLNISRNSLSGTIPSQLGNVGFVKLYFHQNKLIGTMPDALCEGVTELVADCGEFGGNVTCSCCTSCYCSFEGHCGVY
mmetsp:Transcript_25791/g.39997  ORF Transcript_25791/g.39997 Transcript_25791/m.39997 type:complete len:828 (+) Transcript_25791:159-2642(+)|eukprot:CAMPEP_0196819284 /NCGR_PEP_ID=MMETSP1362-20130617/69863_1 /TAXON_ID=163516 /ORGANISM="Leptocylindrus danicus, Strain CCMP1856" /LENGTH=827 /DNA_ID=CAMNT_0042197705 /DNA_START=40 /DNA_END=2523 /DNA_ORIENTATION=-